jgi:acyl-CoA reductase-like NAD-dependent aldehyde dehydrogenase
MKRAHRVPLGWAPKAEPISDRYQSQVDLATAQGERRCQEAQRRVAAACERLTTARAITSTAARQRAVHAATELLELRRQELAAIHREMTGSPASAQHRGYGSHRAVPNSKVI